RGDSRTIQERQADVWRLVSGTRPDPKRERGASAFFRISYDPFRTLDVKQVSTGILDDEIHDRLRVFRRKRKMPFARPDDHRDLSAELLITFLDDASLAVQPGTKGAAVVRARRPFFRERRKVVNRLLLARHETL